MRHFVLLLASVHLAACSVGPDFRPPEAQLPDTWPSDNLSANRASASVDSQWWQQFNDTQLTALIERTAKTNLDIRSASNRLEQSRIARKVSGSAQLPSVSAGASYQRERNSANGLSDASGREGQAPFELWSSALDASWEVDLWGHVRRSLEVADAQVEFSQAARHGVLLSIVAETANDYLRLRGVQQQLAVSRENLEIARQSRNLTQSRFDNGVTTNLDTANAAAQVATIEARLPVLQAEQNRLINALSYLIGEEPQALSGELSAPKPIPQATADMLLGLPSELAHRRPDIQQSEAALHRATAAIGVAKADFYPRVSLGASFGFQALEGSDIGAWSSRQWNYGPSLYLPIFQGGRLTGTLELRERQQQEAALDYQRTVLAAWHEVDNALTDYSAEQQHHTALAEAVRQNNLALASARERYRQGATDFINVLSVQRALLETESALANSSTQVTLNRVQLYKTLGGAGQHRMTLVN